MTARFKFSVEITGFLPFPLQTGHMPPFLKGTGPPVINLFEDFLPMGS
jgi:hypothetical protein